MEDTNDKQKETTELEKLMRKWMPDAPEEEVVESASNMKRFLTVLKRVHDRLELEGKLPVGKLSSLPEAAASETIELVIEESLTEAYEKLDVAAVLKPWMPNATDEELKEASDGYRIYLRVAVQCYERAVREGKPPKLPDVEKGPAPSAEGQAQSAKP